jgi:hypothetical protein
MSGKTHQSANELQLTPMEDFKKAVAKILSNTRAESDRQLAEYQASSLRKREVNKRG